jgi:23S rRNA (pseudouridine1915-N3)-methyltransferase
VKLLLLALGKAHESYVKAGTEDFTKRINRYFKSEWKILAPPKNAGSLDDAALKKKEAALISQQLEDGDFLVALDERGSQVSSEKLAAFLQARANESVKRVVFLIGGAYGLDPAIIKQANFTWSLSPLTFPHQLVRLILSEQLYRACTILKNENYHH